MSRAFHYYGRLRDVRGQFGALPPWARALVWLAAAPGVALIALSILVLAASILALLLLALPVYMLLKSVLGRRAPDGGEGVGSGVEADSPGRKQVRATVIESFEDRVTP